MTTEAKEPKLLTAKELADKAGKRAPDSVYIGPQEGLEAYGTCGRTGAGCGWPGT